MRSPRKAVPRFEPAADKRALVDRLLEAALVDGKLSPHETTTIAALTKALVLS